MTDDEAGRTPQPLHVSPATPDRRRVEITFEYTFDELREGMRQSPPAQQSQAAHPAQPPKSAWLPRGLFGWVFFVSVAVFIFMFLNRSGGATAAPRPIRPPPPTVDLIVAAGPSLLAAALVGIIVVMISMAVVMMLNKNQKTRDAGREMPTLAVLAVILVGGLGAGALWAQRQPSGWAVSYRLAMALALIPWLVVIVATIAFAVWLSRVQLRILWRNKPFLHRRRTVVLDDDGARSTDGVTDLLYRWSHFHSGFETANCLILVDENQGRHILPKRVMDQATSDQARSIIANHIADTCFRTTPGGFPVASSVRPPESAPSPAAPGG